MKGDKIMSFEPTKVIEIRDGKQIGQTMIQTAKGIPYDNTDSGLTAGNLQDAVDELNSDLTDIGDYDLLADTTSTTETTATVNLSLYRGVLLCLSAYDNTSTRMCSSYYPIGLFKAMGNVVAIENGNGIAVSASYVSDTSIKHKLVGGAVASHYHGYVYGIK
jgi:hypothetical protein